VFARAHIFIAILLYCITYGLSLNQSGLGLVGNNMITNSKVLEVQILARSLESRLNDSAAILEVTSNTPEVRNTPNTDLLNSNLGALHGIPQDSDTQKRNVAQTILSNSNDFAAVAYIMSNGDMYLLEPYSLQQNQTRNNFAFRDYFRGAMITNDTYLGDIITSTASGLKQVVIAVPVHSESNGNIEGIWVGAIDLDLLNRELQSFNLSDNQRVVYVDSNGTKIADSDKNMASNTNETFSSLRSFQNAIVGKSGSIMEEANQKMMVVSYHPVKALQKSWAVLWMQQQNQ
jgi:Cache domain